jgi:hypothetical protein
VTMVDSLHEYYDRHCPWYKLQLWQVIIILDIVWGKLVTMVDLLCEYYVGHCSMRYTCDNGWFIMWILCWTMYYEVYLWQWLIYYVNIVLDNVVWGILVTMGDSLQEYFWTLPIAWGVLDVHDVLRVDSAPFFRLLVVKLYNFML